MISEVADRKIILPILCGDSDALAECIKDRIVKLENISMKLVDEISRMQVVNIARCGEEQRTAGHLQSIQKFVYTLKGWTDMMEVDLVPYSP
jgi:hypothetical protein